jgi:hypothetical protein
MLAGRRWRLVSALVLSLSLIVGCGDDPPNKEIQEAETAIEAARAAGAATYAKDDFSAAAAAIKNAHTAVDARDYRLALNDALEARDRATVAARDAADRKAAARADADRLLRNAALALVDVRARLRTAQAAQKPPRVLNAARKAAADSENRVQEARAAFERADYPGVIEMLAAPTARLRESIRALSGNETAPAKRPR